MTPNEIDQLADLIANRVAEKVAATSGGDAWLDAKAAAEMLGCSVATIERWTRSGKIPSAKIGRLRRYRRLDLLSLSEGDSNEK